MIDCKISSSSGPKTVRNSARTYTQGFLEYDYGIAVVDLDPKPRKKIPYYYEQDSKIATLYTKLEKDGKLLKPS